MSAYPNSGIKKRVIEVLTAHPYKWMNVEAIAALLGCASDPSARTAISAACQALRKKDNGLTIETDTSSTRVFRYRYRPAAPTLPAEPVTPDTFNDTRPQEQLSLFEHVLAKPTSILEWIDLTEQCLREISALVQICDQQVKEAYARGRRDERDRIAAALA